MQCGAGSPFVADKKLDDACQGKGYWVKASQRGVLKLSGGTPKALPEETGTPETPGITLRVEDATGQVALLYLADADPGVTACELPPVPPAGILDVRFSGNTNTERVETGPHTLRLSSATYPVKVTATGLKENMHFRLKDCLGGALLNTSVQEGRPITVSHKLSELLLETTDRPTEYLLSQNYPNPFNPSTGIRYQVPGVSDVKLTVYDLLGREVAVLVNERKAPGTYEVTFDASGLSSGVYLCRMQTGNFVDTKKLVLVK